MRDLTTWRGLLPREMRDRGAFLFVVFGIPFAVVFEVFYIYPKYFDYFTPIFYAHAALATFILLNLYTNLYKIMSIDASGRNSDLPSVLKPEWKYCYICHLNAPPRAYHCPLCDECILKRDHHCSFAGCCIGYHNHRFYIMAVFYAWLAAQFMLWLHWNFIWEGLGGLSFSTVWYIIIPQFALIFRCISIYQFILCGIQMSSLTILALTSYMLISQILLITRGQSQHEFIQNVRSYDLGPYMNFCDVLGSRWYVAWISPFIPSPLFGDGLKFPLAKEYINVKDL